MKKFWYKSAVWNKNAITTAIESGFEAIYVPVGFVEKTKELSKIKVISEDKKADMVLGNNVKETTIKSKGSEDEVVKIQGKIPTIIKNKDWTIIPLENLLSKTSNLIQSVRSCDEARVALETLEKGADGILLETDDLNEIKKTGELIAKIQNEKLSLVEVEIKKIESVGIGDRVVVDTANILRPGQGMLVGDSSSAMFLVYNENVETPYCDPRPFRVNAGGVHAYIKMPHDETKYIGELKSGSVVLTVDQNGNSEDVIVGRVKIEKRPMLLVEADHNGKKISLVMQNAETIRLTQKNGQPISVTKLKKGDKVLAFIQEGKIGRHFGKKIEESILEK